MSYLAPDFDPDVFVSYSHGDPVEGRAPLRDWTRDLIQRLRDRLHALDTEFDDLRLWMDPDLDPTADLTSELREKASACGVLVIVMSNRYLKSRWCERERDWFRQEVDARVTRAGRVFIIHAQKTDLKLWPEFLLEGDGGARMTGFAFFDPKDGFPLGFQFRVAPDEYYKELGVLHTWLVARLRELRERTALRAPTTRPAAVPSVGPRRIYLHARPEGEPVRAEIDLALRGDGIVPLTAQAGGGGDLAAFQREAKARIETAKRCEAMALLRPDSDERFVGDLLDIGVDERERIVDARGAPLPCAVLDKSGEGLPIDVAPFGIARFDVNRPDWRGAFRAWLDASRAPASAAP